jgi:hypothetical protein
MGSSFMRTVTSSWKLPAWRGGGGAKNGIFSLDAAATGTKGWPEASDGAGLGRAPVPAPAASSPAA